eukprot:COSAG05_NODE_77_length_21410_cov_1079.308573_12_plen_33_part_00
MKYTVLLLLLQGEKWGLVDHDITMVQRCGRSV